MRNKKLIVSCLMLGGLLLVNGCALGYTSKVTPNGKRDRALVCIILNKSAAENYQGLHVTKTTTNMLSFDNAKTETQPEVVKAIVEGAVTGAMKSYKPIP